MVSRRRTLAAVGLLATLSVLAATSFERHVVRGESMKPALRPRDTVVSVRCRSLLGLLRGPRVGDVAVLELPWEHDLIGIKRLVAGPGEAWGENADRIEPGPGWVAIGDERILSTDSRHHGRVPTTAIRGVMLARVEPPDAGATPRSRPRAGGRGGREAGSPRRSR
ncbi:MAG: S26 family signal peptidase [Acidimicrobiales bacterium]|nr:S26 family signal peptidase [Acidimicrobiales bacterium]